MGTFTRTVLFCLALCLLTLPAAGAELVQLDEKNWDAFVPAGKEVDAIYGDYVLRNEYVVAVIAQPVDGRHANLTVHDVAGCLIDYTLRAQPNDQLSAFYPGARRAPYREVVADASSAIGEGGAPGKSLTVRGRSNDGLRITTTYSVADGVPYLTVVTRFENTSADKDAAVALSDALRADRTFEDGADEGLNLMWVYDRWFGQAYGFVGGHGGAQLDRKVTAKPGAAQSGRTPGAIFYELGGQRQVTLKPGQGVSVERMVLAGRDVLEVKGLASYAAGVKQTTVALFVVDDAGAVANADVVIEHEVEGKAVMYGRGRTDAEGRLVCYLPQGEYTGTVSALGRSQRQLDLTVQEDEAQRHTVKMDQPGYIVGHITDERGGPIPCKVQFIGVGDTKDPFFTVDSGEGAVVNCVYTHTGAFTQEIGPGSYKVTISYGPEYDAIFKEVEVKRGQVTKLTGRLVRVVDTAGWVSAEYHSHSSPSGDNTSSQRGRVLNLLCEHLEFAPCTEHQRIDSYVPVLNALGVRHLMATCSGIELTGSPGDVNHQNAFPLVHKPHTQNGGAGGPVINSDPLKQVLTLVYWDDSSDKLIQQNHPNLIKVVLDKNVDGKYDGGFGSIDHMDVTEVHPPYTIFDGPIVKSGDREYPNRIVSWMQLHNLGLRVPGVVNTDAHYNHHGSGWLRNYIMSSTDDPAKIDVMEMVHNSEKGRLVMSTGPFMTVRGYWLNEEARVVAADPGGEIAAEDGKVALQVRVQCPNWFDINRVQVFVNGRADPKLNFTRKANAAMFGDGVVKFDAEIRTVLKEDAHLIVATIGEGKGLGIVFGDARGRIPPCAVSNPIFVDVDGGGFKPNGDTLGVPLPTKED